MKFKPRRPGEKNRRKKGEKKKREHKHGKKWLENKETKQRMRPGGAMYGKGGSVKNL